MTPRFLLAGAAALALAACGGDAGESDLATDDTAATGEGAIATDPAAEDALPTTAQAFASLQAASDLYEIEAGRLAERNGTAQAVKDFGAMMVRDHTASTESLRTAAGEASGITIDPRMTARNATQLEALRNAGDDFDSVYQVQQITAHQNALARLSNYALNGDNDALKAFAEETATAVEEHLELARELR